MKLLQDINEAAKEQEQLDELFTGVGRKMAGKALSAVGAKGAGANLQARGETAQQAKKLKVGFQQFAGQMGKALNAATVDDLATFIKSKNLPFVANALGNVQKTTPLKDVPTQALDAVFQAALAGGTKRAARAQTPAQPQNQAAAPKAAGGGAIQQFIKSLTPSQKNSFIAALQSS